MRISAETSRLILSSAKNVFGDKSKTFLFGSRADDSKAGGDIDLLVIPETVLTAKESLEKELQLKSLFFRQLGERQVDVLVDRTCGNNDQLIYQIAQETGVELC